MPIDPVVLLTFVPAALALNVTPGADMMLCMAQGLKGGPRAGWLASGGIALGGLIHGVLAGLGLAALVATHPPVFEAIRWGGAGYLLWLAWQAMTAPSGQAKTQSGTSRPFFDGLVVNLTNPKVILFTLAFIPLFTDPARPILPQFLVFSAILSTGGFVVNGMAGVLAGAAKARLANDRVARWASRVSAAVFAGLAIRLMLQERS